MLELNKCGSCTACCTICPVEELNKSRFKTCEHADRGCNIYESRPEPCRVFECAYIQQPLHAMPPLALRPDMCGVMFQRDKNHVMVGSVLFEPEGADAQNVDGQIEYFKREGFKVLLIHEV